MNEKNNLQKSSIKKLLLVDDNSKLQNSYIKTLKFYKRDLIVDIAKNGLEAVEKVNKNGDYNAIIMDIEMPIMGGIEASKKIRQLGYSKIILAHTTLFEEEAKTAMLEGEMDGFLLKQLGIDKLLAYLEKYDLI